jgi:hypothetical protein
MRLGGSDAPHSRPLAENASTGQVGFRWVDRVDP